MMKLLGAFIGPLLLTISCNAQTPPPKPTGAMGGVSPAMKAQSMKNAPPVVPGQPSMGVVMKVDQATLDKGKKLYMANCIQCHNRDPNIKGPIGPEMVDAPLEVMTSKVMTAKYPQPLPAGFVPKRKSQAMRAIPKLKNDIPAIHAWVQSMKKKK